MSKFYTLTWTEVLHIEKELVIQANSEEEAKEKWDNGDYDSNHIDELRNEVVDVWQPEIEEE